MARPVLSNLFISILFCQLFYIAKCNDEHFKEPWIGPHDMGFSDKPATKTVQKTDTSKETVVSTHPTIDPFLKRHIQRIIHKLNIGDDTKHVNVDIHVSLTTYDIMSLKTFVQFDVTNGSMSERMRVLHSLESTLEKMLKHVENLEEEGQLTSATSLFTTCLSWLEAHFDIIPLVIAMALTLCVWRGMPMWKLTVSTLVISCGWEWSLMYKKVLAKKFEMMVRENGGIPAHCSPDAKSFLHRLLPGVFSNDKDCIRYQEALTVNAYLEVNPAMAVVETLSKLLLQPLGHLGEKLGIFFNEVLSANTYLASPAVAFFLCLFTNCHNCDIGWIQNKATLFSWLN